MLLEHGADPAATSATGRSAISVADERRCERCNAARQMFLAESSRLCALCRLANIQALLLIADSMKPPPPPPPPAQQQDASTTPDAPSSPAIPPPDGPPPPQQQLAADASQVAHEPEPTPAPVSAQDSQLGDAAPSLAAIASAALGGDLSAPGADAAGLIDVPAITDEVSPRRRSSVLSAQRAAARRGTLTDKIPAHLIVGGGSSDAEAKAPAARRSTLSDKIPMAHSKVADDAETTKSPKTPVNARRATAPLRVTVHKTSVERQQLTAAAAKSSSTRSLHSAQNEDVSTPKRDTSVDVAR
jgi:hypothetical protein